MSGNELGFLGTSVACRQILEGNYVPLPELDSHSKELIKELE